MYNVQPLITNKFELYIINCLIIVTYYMYIHIYIGIWRVTVSIAGVPIYSRLESNLRKHNIYGAETKHVLYAREPDYARGNSYNQEEN